MAGLSNPIVVLLMGVSGSGKSTIGTRLAAQLGASYFDADSFHSPEAIAKMKGGTPLDDRDRMPWLARIAQKIELLVADDESGVIGCSALKRAYRDEIVTDRDEVVIAYLKGSHDTIARRMAARHEHFMPLALLDSQFATLEEPTPDEHPIVLSVDQPPGAIASVLIRKLVELRPAK